jgi:hypothetical protein
MSCFEVKRPELIHDVAFPRYAYTVTVYDVPDPDDVLPTSTRTSTTPVMRYDVRGCSLNPRERYKAMHVH